MKEKIFQLTYLGLSRSGKAQNGKGMGIIMKKSNFVAMLIGVISFVFLGLGMCMALLPEWNAFVPGVILGCAGIVFALIAVLVWRKMEGKKPIQVTGKTILTVVIGVVGALVFGGGMCTVMVWNSIVLGTIIGLVGIILLISLIPLCMGLK